MRYIFYIRGIVDEKLFRSFSQFILGNFVGKIKLPCTLELDILSPGGDMEIALKMINTLNRLNQERVTTISKVTGDSGSAAISIALACIQRTIVKNCRIVMHDIKVSIGAGIYSTNDIRYILDAADAIKIAITRILSNHLSDKQVNEYIAMMNSRNKTVLSTDLYLAKFCD